MKFYYSLDISAEEIETIFRVGKELAILAGLLLEPAPDHTDQPEPFPVPDSSIGDPHEAPF
jgi:hypothetical protein